MLRARLIRRIARVPQLRMPLRASAPAMTRAFSAATQKRASADASSKDLADALRAEYKIELESAQEAVEDSVHVTEWADKNGFNIEVSDGAEQVQLVKQISGSETIRIFFSVSDIVNDNLFDEDTAGEQDEGEDGVIETPVRVNIVVEKPKGAVGIEAFVQDDLVLVESVIPYASATLAIEESADAEYKRRLNYQGPPFNVLDPSVQSSVQSYLESRGLDGDFALFIQEYASYRENKEYTNWLKRVAEIVES